MNNVRLYRLRRGLSQEELAELAGLHRRTVQNCEHGYNTEKATRDRICKVLGEKVATLFPDRDKEKHERARTRRAADRTRVARRRSGLDPKRRSPKTP